MLISPPLPPQKKKPFISACIATFDVFSIQRGKGKRENEAFCLHLYVLYAVLVDGSVYNQK